MTTPAKAPALAIVQQQAALRDTLPFSDRADFEDASRGLIGRLDPCVVRAAGGRVVWDNGSCGLLSGEAPDSVNPSLWRQSPLVARDGLFEVTEGIYQVRGLDLSNMTVVEGPTLGRRAHRGVPVPAAGPIRVPVRPDPAAAEQGAGGGRDRRADAAPARAPERLARPRLLRLGQPLARLAAVLDTPDTDFAIVTPD